MLKKADIGVGLYLLCAVVFFIVPIPSLLLDVMLAFNIAIALIILFNVLFVKEVLDMSFFPTLLLFTTIFRISLNVSSTRLILLTGDPGNVVRTFGSFVGGGNMVVGTIVFIVLVLIQFIVINKGSERVSEVTARFTLDAMAGKQMAIDSDLNTGAITDKEAAIRRKKLQQENSFFGSMDGATKFVKGDINVNNFLLECKTVTKEQNTFTLHREWFEKNKEEAFAMGKDYNAVVIDFGDGEQHYIIDERLFKKLLTYLKEEMI